MLRGKCRLVIPLLVAGAALVWLRSRRHVLGRAVANWRTFSAPSAAAYDAVATPALRGFFRRIAQDVAARAPHGGELRVLEVGSGPGRLAVTLAEVVPSAQVTGLDLSPEMVARASTLAERRGLAGRLSFRVGDVAALPFPDADFDVVVSTFSAHHWQRPAESVAEIVRVLRPGGVAWIYDLPDWFTRIERRETSVAGLARSGAGTSRVVARLGPVPLVHRAELRHGPPG